MKPKPGDILALKILDHSMHDGDSIDDGPMEIEVYGKLIKESKKSYTIATWIESSNHINSNTELFTILKSAIVTKRRLK